MTSDLRAALLRALIASLRAAEPPADVLTRAEAARAAQRAAERRRG